MFASFLTLWLVLPWQLAGNKMKHIVTLKKLQISLGVNTVGNIWEHVSTQLNKASYKDKFVFRHFNVEMFI